MIDIFLKSIILISKEGNQSQRQYDIQQSIYIAHYYVIIIENNSITRYPKKAINLKGNIASAP